MVREYSWAITPSPFDDVARRRLVGVPAAMGDGLAQESDMTSIIQTSTHDEMRTVKAAWDKAPAGPKKDAALTHYQAAEKARTANNDTDCIAALKSASEALV